MQQGQSIKITPKGIVRNTPETITQDGEFFDAVNLREEDGALRPVDFCKELEGFEGQAGNLDKFKAIFIHTNSGYKNFLGLEKSTNNIVFFARWNNDNNKAEFQNFVTLIHVEDDVEFNQIGNLAIFIDNGQFTYLLYEKAFGAYRVINSDFNGLQWDTLLKPELDIKFRVTPNILENGELETIALRDKVWHENQTATNTYITGKFKKDYENKYFSRAGSPYSFPLNTNTVSIASEKLESTFALLNKTLKLEKKLGRLKGFFKLIFAYELFDGNYFLYSQPILMCQPTDSVSNWSQENSEYSHLCYWNENSVLDTNSVSPNLSEHLEGDITYFKQKEGTKNKFRKYRKDTYIDVVTDIKTIYFPKPTAGQYYEFSIPPLDDSNVINCPYNTIIQYAYEDTNAAHNNTSYLDSVISYSNKLQYRIDKKILQEYKDIIKGVSVFITPEIYGFKNNNRTDINGYKLFHNGRFNYWKGGAVYKDNFWGSTYTTCRIYTSTYPQPKLTADIIKELERNDIFYKVASIDFEKLVVGDWIDIDLKTDGILANLTAQESLRVDNFSRNSYMPKTTLTYNGKLHIANYTEGLFHGFPLRNFYQQKALGQQPVTDTIIWKNNVGNGERRDWNNTNKAMVCIEVDIETEDGLNTVVRYEKVPLIISILPTLAANHQIATTQNNNSLTANMLVDYGTTNNESPQTNVSIVGNVNFNGGYTIYSLNPMLSYPDNRAKKMRITIQEARLVGTTIKYFQKKLEFPLKASDFNNFAYYIDKDIKPIDIVLDTETPPYVTPFEAIKQQRQGNMLKVSAINNPMYFPAENTYRVGNGEIIRLASNAVSVSTGQVGATPLFVFSKEGIWGLFVDASGELTYTNSRPISRDVLNNVFGLKNIDNGIVFTTDRGLMVISGTQVIEISQKVEGKMIDYYADGDTTLLYAKELLNNDKSVRLINQIDGDNEFIDYIKNARLAYNYTKKEFCIASPNFEYFYILSAGNWYKRQGRVEYFVEDYPYTYANIANKLLKIDYEKKNGNDTMFVSRAFKFGTQEFKQSYRAIIRGLFEVQEDVFVNNIDLRKIDMSVKADKIVLSNPIVREITIKKDNSIKPIELSYSGKEPYTIRELNLYSDVLHNCEKVFRHKNIGSLDTGINIDAKGIILLNTTNYFDIFPSAHKDGYDLVLKWNGSMRLTTTQTGIVTNKDFSYDIDLFKDNFENYSGINTWGKSGDVLLSDYADYNFMSGVYDYKNSGDVYNTNFAVIGTWQKNGNSYSVLINGVSRNLQNIDRTYFLYEYEETVYSNNTGSLSENIIEPSYKNYNTFLGNIHLNNINPNNQYKITYKKTGSLVARDMIAAQLGNITTNINTGISAASMLEDTDVTNISVVNEVILTKDIVYNGAEIILYNNLIRNIESGQYSSIFVFNDINFTNMVSGETYKFTDINGNYYIFYYQGETEITYSQLLQNILNGVYEFWSENNTTPKKVYVENGENIRLFYNNSILEFQYQGNTGQINGQDLIDLATSPTAAKIPFLNSDYQLEIVNGTNIDLTLPNGSNYRFRFFDNTQLVGAIININYAALMYNIQGGVYTKLPDFDSNFPIALELGKTRLIDINGQVYTFMFEGLSPINYSTLIKNILSGMYKLIEPQTKYAGIYVYGSNDCMKWVLLGRNEKTGTFRDLGCFVERTDCKYFKVLFFGNLSHNSTIDYIEFSVNSRLLGNKIR